MAVVVRFYQSVDALFLLFLVQVLLLLFHSVVIISSHTTSESDPCHFSNSSDYKNILRSDQITVLINGYSESRIPLLQSIAAAYSASPIVSSVLLLWGNPSTPPHTLSTLLSSSSSFGPAPISLLRHASSTLNARFLPRPSSIRTRAILICDDDVEVDSKSLEFAFRVWGLNPDRLIGLFARSHDMDVANRKWMYTVHPDKYSIVLTKWMILKTEYLFEYSCEGGAAMSGMRRTVDGMHNCEDILMNFVVADRTNAGPILVGAERVRDWGDARNEEDESVGNKVREVGLSSRRREHRKRRGECIRAFHKAMGRMPLRYSYGKLVHSVAEQGLCLKGGKLVYCDQYQ